MHTLRLKLEVDKNTAYIMEKRFRILAHISNQIRKHVKKLLSRLENDKQYQQALNEYIRFKKSESDDKQVVADMKRLSKFMNETRESIGLTKNGLAMDWGPVERKVWSHYKSCGNGYIPVLLGINFVKEEKEYTKTAEKIYIEDIKLINGIVDLLLGYDNTYLMSIIRKQPPFMKGLKNFPGYEISDKDMMDFFK